MGRKKLIVVGAGFGGLQLLENLDEDLFDVILIDKLNHHQFQPLFYQVATSQIEPGSISFPLRKIFQKRKNTRIRLAELLSVEPVTKTIETTIGPFAYDYLVIGIGCKTNFFGNDELAKHTFGLKTTFDAIDIRNNLLQGFEDTITATKEEKDYLLNIVIVGAGPTGVELAGALAEIKKNVLPRDFPDIDFKDLNIILLEGSSHTLNVMSDMAREASEKYLKALGVHVRTNVFVKEYDGKTVVLNSGETIKSKHVIWAAGVEGNRFTGLDESVILKNGRIKVNRFNQVENHPGIYAIGDIAYMETPNYPKGHPQLANVAVNQGKRLAKNLKALIRNKPMKEYEYTDLGSMATIGKNKAVVDLPFIKFKGLMAWLTWMFLHLMLILSVRNKLIIFINWAWNYFTKDTSLRLILKDQNNHKKPKPDLSILQEKSG